MDVPDIVRERLGDERRLTSVNVGGDDRVYVTPPRTLVYHASGLFSRESIEEYSHDAKRFDVSASRREATFAFEYDDEVEAFSIPRERIETVLPPVLAGVLRTTGHIDDDESVEESYRFGERTVVVTEARVLTSVGEAVWDHDHDGYAYENVTDIAFDDGDLVITLDGRSRRIELDDDGGRETYETVETALLAYHGVESIDELGRRPSERSQPTDEPPESERTPGGPLDSSTDTAPPAIDPVGPEPLSGRGGESSKPADPSSPPETTDRDDTAASPERTDVADDAGRSDSSPAPSPPPSSPAPGGPVTESLIPEAPGSEGPAEGSEPTEPSQDVDEPPSDSGTETSADASANATADEDLAGELDALRERVDHQHRLLERNQELLERLVEHQDAGRLSDDP